MSAGGRFFIQQRRQWRRVHQLRRKSQQKFPKPRCNVPQAELIADDGKTLTDKPVENFHSMELRFTDIGVQFYYSCVMFE